MAKILVSYRLAPRIRNFETGAMVAAAFRDLGHTVTEYAKMYESIEWHPDSSNALQEEFDLLLYLECNDPETFYPELRTVRAKKTAGWFFDTSYTGILHRRIVEFFNFQHTFFANPNYVFGYLAPGSKTSLLPYAACEKRHYRKLSYPKIYDFGLVGSSRPDRVALIDRLKTEGLDAHLISDVYREAYINALASCRVVINQNPSEGRCLSNMRFYETLMAGSLLLTQSIDEPDRYLATGLECLSYDDLDDLVVKCKSLIGHPEWVDKVREAGQQRVLRDHSYVNRARTILETLGL